MIKGSDLEFFTKNQKLDKVSIEILQEIIKEAQQRAEREND